MPATENLEHVSLSVAGRPLQVVSMDGEERLSKLFQFTVECATGADCPKPKSIINEPATIVLRDGAGAERTVTGIVAKATSNVFDNDQARLVVVVRPAAYQLAVGQDCRSFQDQTIVDVVKQVMQKGGFPTRWTLTSSYPVRPYTVQYREDDWGFAARLLENNGIYFWFDHAASSTLVFADDSRGAPDAPGGATISFAYESGLHAAGEVLEELASGTQVTPSKFTVGSFDPDRPQLQLRETTGDGPLEIYSCRGGGVTTPAECAALAQIGAERAGAHGQGVAGITTSVRLSPGVVFECENHQLSELDGRYVVTAVQYRVRQRTQAGGAGAERRYGCRFEAIAADTPYRPPLDTRPAEQLGAQSGIVVGPRGAEIHPDERGRVRVQQHWDRLGARDHTAGTWMRVSQRGSAESMLLPRMGWSVLTFNEEGAIDTPSVFNRIPDGEHLPPYPLPANKTRLTFKTATSPGGGSFNEIRFEDKKGQEEMFLNASKDMNVLALHLKNEIIERDQTRSVGVDHTLTVHKDYRHKVTNDQQVSIGGNESLSVHGGGGKTVTGNESVSIGGSRNLNVGEDHTTTVEKNRQHTVGAAMIDVCLGPIAADGGFFTVLVGGAMVHLSGGSISEDVGKVSLQLIGGAKLETAKANRGLAVGKQYLETVGGALVLKANGRFVDNADETLTWVVGGPLTAKAPSVWVEAKEKIELTCGSSVITIVPDSIEIKSPAFDLSGAEMQFETSKVDHN